MTSEPQDRTAALAAGLRCRCPRCGQGRLFDGFLTLAPGCTSCGLSYDFADAGDGPAVFVILVAGLLVAGGALLTELIYEPPYWVHALIWLPVGIGLPLLMLRPFKSMLVALQYRNEAQEGRLGQPPP